MPPIALYLQNSRVRRLLGLLCVLVALGLLSFSHDAAGEWLRPASLNRVAGGVMEDDMFTEDLDGLSSLKPADELEGVQQLQQPDLADVPLAGGSPAAEPRTPRVAVFNAVYHHNEVIGAFAYSLERFGASPICYVSQRGLTWGIDKIFRQWYSTPFKKAESDRPALQEAIAADELDLLVLATCSNSLPYFKEALADPRSTTQVACVVHHSYDVDKAWDTYADLAAQGRLTLLGLSDHVTRAVDALVRAKAQEDGEPAWLKLKTKTFIPLFPVKEVLEKRAAYKRPAVFPNEVVIQGNIVQGRRDYRGIFKQIEKHLAVDPASWGWQMNETLGHYVPMPAADGSEPAPFTLRLLGALDKNTVIPEALQLVAPIHSKLRFIQYYEMMASSDLLLPAFANKGYYKETASSSIAAAVLTRLPILGTPTLTNAYTYLAPPAQLVQPEGELVFDSIAALRERSRNGTLKLLSEEEEGRGFDELTEKLQRENDQLWAELLDLPKRAHKSAGLAAGHSR